MSIQCKVITFLFLMAASMAQPIEPPSQIQKNNTSTEVSSWSYTNMAALGTAILVVGVGAVSLVAYLSAIFLPVTTYKICYALGGCQNTMDAYVDELIGDQLSPARNIRNKRTIQYMEPILVALAKAYEEYADEDMKKNFKMAR